MAHESRSHGPGHEPEGDGLKQHQHMARKGEAMPGGDFGVSVLPGRRRIVEPGGPPETGLLTDAERTPHIAMGPGKMKAQAHPHMGAHQHHEDDHIAKVMRLPAHAEAVERPHRGRTGEKRGESNLEGTHYSRYDHG